MLAQNVAHWSPKASVFQLLPGYVQDKILNSQLYLLQKVESLIRRSNQVFSLIEFNEAIFTIT